MVNKIWEWFYMSVTYSVVIPAFNEEEVIKMSYERLKGVMDKVGDYELIFINDGSRDDTLKILKEIAALDKSVKVISFSRNFGHQEAVSAGLAHVTGRAVIIIDADLQDPPEVIPDMIEKWKQGSDIVYGKRAKREGETAFKKVTAWGFYRVLNALGAQKVPRDTGDFRLIDRKVADVLNAMPEKNRFLRGMSAWAGFRQEPYEYVRASRAAGVTKYTMKKMLKLAGDGITAFSNKPLKLPLVIGCTLMALSTVYLVLAVVFWCLGIWNEMHFVFSLLFMMIGILNISVGIQGIYIGRVYDEAKGRPIFIIDEKVNIDE
jgi:glycosyltransferase involved in cell wall biosynthesis